MRTFALIGLVALLAGCGIVPLAPVHFARKNTVEAQRQQDFNQCWYQAVLINPHPPYPSIRASACMLARGYTRRDCRRCPPGGVVANLPASQQATTSAAAVAPTIYPVMPAPAAPTVVTRQQGGKVYSEDECIGPVIMGRCHGSILPNMAYHPTCHGTWLNGQCTGPMF